MADVLQNATILVLDDDANITRLTRSVLSMSGCDVTESNNPIEALKIVKSHAFDLILVDIMMPEMDGVEFIRQSRQTVTNVKSRYAILSAKKLKETDRREIFDLGVEIMAKPFMPNQLVDMIADILKKEPLTVVPPSTDGAQAKTGILESVVQSILSPAGTPSLKDIHTQFEELIETMTDILRKDMETQLRILLEKLRTRELTDNLQTYLQRAKSTLNPRTLETLNKAIENFIKDQEATIHLFVAKMPDEDKKTKKYYLRLLIYTVFGALLHG